MDGHARRVTRKSNIHVVLGNLEEQMPSLKILLAKKLATVFAILALAGILAGSALAQGPITITSARVQPDQHLNIAWSGPSNGIEFGAIQLATRPDTGSDGNFYTENRIDFELLSKGQTFWVATDPLPVITKAGTLTLYARVSGWDDYCQFVDYGDGITDWLGCEAYSPVYSFPITSVCHRVVVKPGHRVRRGKRRIWVKPIYRNVCRWQ